MAHLATPLDSVDPETMLFLRSRPDYILANMIESPIVRMRNHFSDEVCARINFCRLSQLSIQRLLSCLDSSVAANLSQTDARDAVDSS